MDYPNDSNRRHDTTTDVSGRNLKANQVLKAIRHADGTEQRIYKGGFVNPPRHPSVSRGNKGGT